MLPALVPGAILKKGFMCNYCNLHSHSDGSLLDGAVTPMRRAEKAAELGQTSLSISDHGSLMNVPDHLKACREFGIRPHVGIEAYFKPDRLKKDDQHRRSYHLLLTAKNQAGWQNLIKLSTESYKSGFYYKPCVDYELLEKYSEGIIATSGCISGYIPKMILANRPPSEIAEAIERHLAMFGDNYYFEIMPHDIQEQRMVNQHLAKYSLDYNIPVVATNDSHYADAENASTQDVLLMIATNQTVNKRKQQEEKGEEVYQMGDKDTLHMMSAEEMKETFDKFHPDLTDTFVNQAIAESGKISDKIEDIELDSSLKIPKIYEDEDESKLVLENWCREGLSRIGKADDDVYVDRLMYELDVIYDMKLQDYFVMAADIVRWARGKEIRISSGRGSAAASLVCYLTKVTMIDPVAHKFKFERFLNKNRKGMPDIDLDFDPERIEEVIDYIVDRYGEEKVCAISAVGTYKPKSSIKDVARVLSIPFDEVNKVTKAIPDPPNTPDLHTLYKDYDEVAEFLDKYPEVKKHAFAIEGMKSRLSKHAAGIVISNKPITDYMPIMKGKTGYVTAWSDTAGAEWITGLGFMKLDILSINGLTKQGRTIDSIYQRTGKKINLDDLSIATDPNSADEKVLDIFRQGNTLGIWQFGSPGASRFIKDISPDGFIDIVAANALYRPGGTQGGDAFEYGPRKNGQAPATYWHPSVKPYLENTHGIVAFQEQLMEIAEELGGFTPVEADEIRKVISKLYRMGPKAAEKAMAKYEARWIEGCAEHGLNEKEALHIWERYQAFGGYGFNFIHASSYGFTAYQDAWLKTYYPMDFYASELSFGDNPEKVIHEAKFNNVFVKPPDINRSGLEFKIDGDKILYGLMSVKYVGAKAIEPIIANRPYTSIDDFRAKVPRSGVNSKALEYLIKAGAFDNLDGRENADKKEKRLLEKEAIGVELTGSEDSIAYSNILDTRVKSELQVKEAQDGTGLTVGGEITNVREIKIKQGQYKGKPMAFADIEYKMEVFNCVFFTDKFYKYQELLSPGNIVIVRGRKSDRGGIVVDTAAKLEDLAKALEKQNG
jgi:DNA polymerase III subunit alpha